MMSQIYFKNFAQAKSGSKITHKYYKTAIQTKSKVSRGTTYYRSRSGRPLEIATHHSQNYPNKGFSMSGLTFRQRIKIIQKCL